MALTRINQSFITQTFAVTVSVSSIIPLTAGTLVFVCVSFKGADELGLIDMHTNHVDDVLHEVVRDTDGTGTLTAVIYSFLQTTTRVTVFTATMLGASGPGPCLISLIPCSGGEANPPLVGSGASGGGIGGPAVSICPAFDAAAGDYFMFHVISDATLHSFGELLPGLFLAGGVCGQEGGIPSFMVFQGTNQFDGLIPAQSAAWDVESIWVALAVAIQMPTDVHGTLTAIFPPPISHILGLVDGGGDGGGPPPPFSPPFPSPFPPFPPFPPPPPPPPPPSPPDVGPDGVIIPSIVFTYPPTGQATGSTTPVEFEARGRYRSCLVRVTYPLRPDLGWDFVFDGEEFGPDYQGPLNRRTTLSSVLTGYAFSVLRDTGWPSPPHFTVWGTTLAGVEVP